MTNVSVPATFEECESRLKKRNRFAASAMQRMFPVAGAKKPTRNRTRRHLNFQPWEYDTQLPLEFSLQFSAAEGFG